MVALWPNCCQFDHLRPSSQQLSSARPKLPCWVHQQAAPSSDFLQTLMRCGPAWLFCLWHLAAYSTANIDAAAMTLLLMCRLHQLPRQCASLIQGRAQPTHIACLELPWSGPIVSKAVIIVITSYSDVVSSQPATASWGSKCWPPHAACNCKGESVNYLHCFTML